MRVLGHVAALSLLLLPAIRPAAAQSTFDPTRLPATTGRVAQYSLTPRGDVDGLILDDGTEVHLPPHLGPQLVQLLRPGDTAVVHGLRARGVPMVQAASVTNPVTSRTLTENGDPAPSPLQAPGPLQALGVAGELKEGMSASGAVKSRLHGPKGDLNGVLLADGTIVRLPPREASRLADRLQPGLTLAVRGSGVSGPLGRVVAADMVGPDPDHLLPLPGEPRPGPPRPPAPPPAPPR